MTKVEQELLIKSNSYYTRFKGDFIAKASVGLAENYDLSDEDKKRAKDLGSINGFSLDYDLDRDGRDETLHVYFRQTNFVLVVEKDGVRTEVDACFGSEEVTDVEVALRDINGDRRPEVWIAYDTGTNWSTFCILEFRGIPGFDSRRRGNTGQGYAGTEVFRTLLRGGAGWGVTVGNDNSIKACAGSNCHSPSSYAFDGERFRLLASELDDDIGLMKNRPFRDERERAQYVYAGYRQAAKPVAAGEFKPAANPNANTTTVVSQLALAGVEFGYACDRGGQDGVSEEIFIREPKGATAAKISANDRLSYPENLSVVPVLLDNVACVAQSIATYEQTHRIYFAPETADRCIPLLAKARTVTLPLINGEHALLEIRLPQDASRRLLTEAYNGCRSGPAGKRAGTAGGLARTASEGPLSEVGPAANDTNARIAQFVGQYLQESGAFSPSGPGGNYADTRRLLRIAAQQAGRHGRQAALFDALADTHLCTRPGQPQDQSAGSIQRPI